MNKIMGRVAALMLSAAVVLTPTIGVMAAPEDIIDTSKKGSITLHKYDMTAAIEDGVSPSQFTADGKAHEDVEDAFKRYAIEGVEFTYAKVADINTISEEGKIEIKYNIPTELSEALGLGKEDGKQYNSTDINNALKNTLIDDTAGKNILEKYIKTLGNRQTMMTDKDGFGQATNLDLGLYMFVETKVPANVHTTVDPFFVSVPMTDVEGSAWFYDVTVYPKNQTDIPDLNKMVRQHDDAVLYNKPEYLESATGSEGDVMDYIFVSRLPKISSAATYLSEYTFVDKMDKGLTYNKDVAIYFYKKRADANANNTDKAIATWTKGSGLFTEIYEGSNSDYNQMTVRPTDKGFEEIDPSFSECYMVVSYSATVNSNETPVLGDVGNTNDVELTWRRTSSAYYDVLEDRARVYTFGIDLTKEFTESDETPNPTKVQFVLQNTTDGHYVTARQASAGKYYVTDATKGSVESEGTVFSPDGDGKLIVSGLEADTYVLTEIQTSDGYSLLKEPITININCTKDNFTASQTTLYDIIDKANNPHKNVIEVNGERASATVDGSDTEMSTFVEIKNVKSTNARVKLTVTNTASFKLPMTGGVGTILFTIGGCVAALGGIVIIVGRKNKKSDVK